MNYNKLYLADLQKNISLNLLQFLKDKQILITGAAGLICSYIVDSLMYANEIYSLNIKVYALGRDKEKMISRFSRFKDNSNLKIIVQDVCNVIDIPNIDYIVHGASNANPKLYVTDPVGTMLGNFIGMYNVLESAKMNNSKVIYISSSEIYGDMNGKTEPWKEDDSGYINTMNYRSCYPNSKRAAEGLCASYKFQYNIDTYVIRLCHTYGPTMTSNDNRAVSSFLRDVINDENIIMKSAGTATRCYCYVGDVFKAIMLILDNGIAGEAYNVSATKNIVSVKDLANIIANAGNKQVIIDMPKNVNEGYNNIELTIMSSDKLDELGWEANYTVEQGLKTSIDILKD